MREMPLKNENYALNIFQNSLFSILENTNLMMLQLIR